MIRQLSGEEKGKGSYIREQSREKEDREHARHR
jgi:stalled ribosome alternative rescue factor ArfA